MPIIVYGPNGVTETFPDGTPREEIDRRMNELMQAPPYQPAPGQNLGVQPPQAPERSAEADWMRRTGETLGRVAGDIGHGLGIMGQGAMDMITLGFDDEIIAAFEDLWSSRNYSQALEGQQERKERAQAENPILYGVGGLGGLVATAPIAPMLTPFGQGSWLGRAGNALATGAAYGGAYGAGSVPGPLISQERLAGAGVGAGFGAVGGAVGSTIGEIAAPLLARGASWIKRAVTGAPRAAPAGMAETEAARRVGGAISADIAGAPAPPAITRRAQMVEQAQTMGVPLILADTGGDTTRRLLLSATDTSPQAQTAIAAQVEPRFAAQGDRIIDELANITGVSRAADTEGQMLALQAAARAANDPAYRLAENAPAAQAMWNAEFAALTRSQTFQQAMRMVTRTASDDAALTGRQIVANPFIDDGAGGMMLAGGAVPDLRYWDLVQRNLAPMITAARRTGDNLTASQATQLRNRLLALLDDAVPEYRIARRGAAEAFGAQDALEAGRNSARLDFRLSSAEFGRRFNELSPEEQALFREGYMSEIFVRIGRTADTRDVINQPYFNNAAARERLEIVFGGQQARQMENMFRLENIFNATRRATGVGQSSTARRAYDLLLAGGVGGAATQIGFGEEQRDWTTPAAIFAGLLTYASRRIYGRIDQNIATEVGRLLASNNPDQIRRAAAILAQTPDGNAVLRSLETIITRGSSMSAAGAGTYGLLPGSYSWPEAEQVPAAERRAYPLPLLGEQVPMPPLIQAVRGTP